ncbi:MAG: hypothetical protein WDW38_007662 [Sanguina aurantia]
MTLRLAPDLRRVRACDAEAQAELWQTPTQVGAAGAKKVQSSIRGDQLHWLSEQELPHGAAAYWQLLATLRQDMNRYFYLSMRRFEGHFAIYPAGSKYSRHIDQFIGSRHRILSVILYLNDSDWACSDGGALRIFMPGDAATAAAVPAEDESPCEALPTQQQQQKQQHGDAEEGAEAEGVVEVWRDVLPLGDDAPALSRALPSGTFDERSFIHLKMNMQPNTPCIVSAARTPFGSFNGSLAGVAAPLLGAVAIRGVLDRAGVRGEDVDEVLFGNVLSANLGQAPASQAAREAGLPATTPCTLVNKVCASSMKAAMMAAQAILCGDAHMVVVAGAESMSNAPSYVAAGRPAGQKDAPPVPPINGLVKDGLWDVSNNMHMGSCAELCAKRYGFTREQQDEHAVTSHRRALHAAQQGWTSREIVPVHLPPTSAAGPSSAAPHNSGSSSSNGGSSSSSSSGGSSSAPGRTDGTGVVTAGNSSPLSDGAAALLMTSYAKAQSAGLPILAVVRGWADANTDPEWFTIAPALAVPKALAKAGLEVSDIQCWEFNEAFSVVDLANRKLLGLDSSIVNMHGGAVSLGHPLGASGARVIVTLLNVMQTHGLRLGCAAICNGGGGASAVVVEMMQQPDQGAAHARL